MRATIKLKLAATFAVVIAMLLVLGGMAIAKMSTLNTAITELIDGPAARLALSQNVQMTIGDLSRNERSMAITTDPALLKDFEESAVEAIAKLDKDIAKGEELATPENKAVWQKMAADLDAYKPLDEEARQLVHAGRPADSSALLLGRARPFQHSITNQAKTLVTLAQAEMEHVDESTDALYANARSIVLTVAALALLVAFAGAFWISRLVTTGLRRVGDAIGAVAIGDLDNDIEVRSNDEIKDLVTTVNGMTANLRQSATLANRIAGGDLTVQHRPLSDKDKLGIALVQMVEKLREVVGEALTAAENVSAGSEQLSASAEQVSQGATEQASAAEQASASMEEMASNIKQNADNAATTEKIARQSAKDAEESGVAVRCARSPRRSASSRRSPARPTCWR
jgi:methyl-accepting chemotaxis protein